MSYAWHIFAMLKHTFWYLYIARVLAQYYSHCGEIRCSLYKFAPLLELPFFLLAYNFCWVWWADIFVLCREASCIATRWEEAIRDTSLFWSIWYRSSPYLLNIVCSNNLFVSIEKWLYAANAVLEGACERVIVGDLYCDIPLGLYVIRGENVVLIGELVQHLYTWLSVWRTYC